MGKTGDAYPCMAEVWDRNIHSYYMASNSLAILGVLIG